MDKKLKVYLNYDAETKEYSIVPPELEAHHIFAFGSEVTETVEELITLIDDVQSFEYNDATLEVDPQDIIGLLLEIVLKCEISDEDKLYIDTINLMMRQHYGQKDKAGKDYYFHPLRVSTRLNLIDTKIVALLHDTIEDTGMTAEKLLQLGYSQETVNAILSVSRKKGESYAEFIARANTNQAGRLVKMADLEDNMDIRRLRDLTEKDWHRLNKYLHSYHFLNGEENDTSLIKD
ncbi:hypothetical protein [Prevotella sp. AGR2160]|uniref:hypothetical protein n=1 Tax=Prevotella sp. AGR2160 TaxID=1280674 RepID=UPI00041CA06D|nr:hypothetical protein [Prevotella sp. AGR2160]